jgi:hypothetical protein
VLFADPWLAIPPEQYRFYQLFFYVPFGLIAWILGAGLIQILCRALGGQGTFEQNLNILGIVVFTPFVFVDTADTLFMILNHGNWNLVFNTVTRICHASIDRSIGSVH